MARAQFNTTALNNSGVPLDGAIVNVYARGTTNRATIYRYETGPTTLSNPFEADLGIVECWLESGPYDIVIEDPAVPATMADRTVSWDAVPGTSGGIPQLMMGADVVRQQHQIGEIIDWWRPSSIVPIPSGFEICDGRQISAANHEFAGVGVAINLPDLRNRFTLGADSTLTDAAAGTPGVNGSSGAPGIRGVGGGHAQRLGTNHVPLHSHGHADNISVALTGGVSASQSAHEHLVNVWHANDVGGGVFAEGGTAQWHMGNTAFAQPVYQGPTNGRTHGVAPGITVSNTMGTSKSGAVTNHAGTAATTDIITTPLYIGVLKLMKVRRG